MSRATTNNAIAALIPDNTNGQVTENKIRQALGLIMDYAESISGAPLPPPATGEALIFSPISTNWVDNGNGTYKNGDTGNGGWTAHGVATKSIAAGVDGRIWLKANSSFDLPSAVLGFKLNNTISTTFFKDAGFYVETYNIVRAILSETSDTYGTNAAGVGDPSAYQYIGIERANSSSTPVIRIIGSTDQVNWSPIFTFNTTVNGGPGTGFNQFRAALLTDKLYIHASLLSQGSDTNDGLINPTGMGVS